MDKLKVRKADLIFSIVLMVISVYFFLNSIKLFYNPFGRELEDINAEELKRGLIEWYKSPGLLPLILSFIIFILALALYNVARRDGAKFEFISKENFKIFLKNKETKVFAIVIGWLIVYIYALIPLCRATFNFFPRFQGFPFMIATFIYLVVFMIYFNTKSKRSILNSFVIASLASAVITYGFGNLALIPLP